MDTDKNTTSQPEWHVQFGLFSDDGLPVPESKCEALWELITTWAEQNNCSIGGGYNTPNSENE